LIRDVDGPDARSRPDIEYPLWLVQRRHMESSLKEHVVDVMHHVQSILIRMKLVSITNNRVVALAQKTFPVLFHH
jgi:hypothetical protein